MTTSSFAWSCKDMTFAMSKTKDTKWWSRTLYQGCQPRKWPGNFPQLLSWWRNNRWWKEWNTIPSHKPHRANKDETKQDPALSALMEVRCTCNPCRKARGHKTTARRNQVLLVIPWSPCSTRWHNHEGEKNYRSESTTAVYVMDQLHMSDQHDQGKGKTKLLEKDTVFWRGMNKEINHMVKSSPTMLGVSNTATRVAKNTPRDFICAME